MLTATIRRVETLTVDVAGEGLEAVQAELEKARPAGFELVSAPVAMQKGKTAITATGTYERRDEMQEIQAPSYAELRAAVPAGWQMLSVRRA